MRLIRVKPSDDTRRRFKERKNADVKTATLWLVNDDEAVHDAALRSGRLDSEPYVDDQSREPWTRRLMRGLSRAWSSG